MVQGRMVQGEISDLSSFILMGKRSVRGNKEERENIMEANNNKEKGLVVKSFECNMFGENTYIVSDSTDECVIIDCGALYKGEFQAMTDYISSHHLRPVHLLATHGHVDHHFGDNDVLETFGLKTEMSEDDLDQLETVKEQAKERFHLDLDMDFPLPETFIADGDTISFGNHQFHVIGTPGHSLGSVCFYEKEEGVLFTGDTLFKGSIGRTDLQGGSMFQIINSLRFLAQLPDEIKIYPGHGEPTTLGFEVAHNPYMDR